MVHGRPRTVSSPPAVSTSWLKVASACSAPRTPLARAVATPVLEDVYAKVGFLPPLR